MLFRSDGGWKATLIDLTEFQPSGTTARSSIMAAVVDMAERTVFLKMTGSQSVLNREKKQLRQLCQSLAARPVT